MDEPSDQRTARPFRFSFGGKFALLTDLVVKPAFLAFARRFFAIAAPHRQKDPDTALDPEPVNPDHPPLNKSTLGKQLANARFSTRTLQPP